MKLPVVRVIFFNDVWALVHFELDWNQPFISARVSDVESSISSSLPLNYFLKYFHKEGTCFAKFVIKVLNLFMWLYITKCLIFSTFWH